MSGKTFVALFSGINVGGNRIVKMVELRQLLEELGFENVATYVQSGNAVFRAGEKDSAAVERTIETAFEKRWGFSSRILVRDRHWFKKLVAENPFASEVEDPRKVHAYALERPATKVEVARLAEKNTGRERFEVKGDALYLFTPDGYGKSKFAELLPRTLKIPGTARNWRTVLTLLKMAEEAQRA